MANRYKYDEKTRKEFIRWWIEESSESLYSARKTYFENKENYDGPIPADGTVHRWKEKYGEKIKKELENENQEGESMAGKEQVDDIVESSQVKNSNSSEEYQPESKNDSKDREQGETKQRKSSGESFKLDFSKITGWIGEHKIQIGLLVAGVAVMVLVQQYRTIDVSQLRGHGEDSSGQSSSSGNDSEGSDGRDPEEAWDGT